MGTSNVIMFIKSAQHYIRGLAVPRARLTAVNVRPSSCFWDMNGGVQGWIPPWEQQPESRHHLSTCCGHRGVLAPPNDILHLILPTRNAGTGASRLFAIKIS